MKTKNLLEILATPSPSGWEKEGQKLWVENVKTVADRVESDPHGNAWAVLDGSDAKAPRVMLEAHADEIGFIVRHIDDKGFLAVGPIGGSDRTLASARRIRLFGSKGVVPGVIGNTAIHLRDTSKDKPAEWKDLFIDVGASSAKDVAKLGIRVGTPAIFVDDAIEFSKDLIVGRALDNRIGGFILASVLAELHGAKKRPQASTCALNAVQEEIGCHGARMAAHRIRPSVAIVFDVTHSTDTPGINVKEHGLVELGKGPAISHGAANHPLVMQRLIDIAEKNKIPLQHEAVSRSTSTDADVIYTSRDGVPCGLISVPLRYMHSPVEMISLADARNAAKLAAAFIRSLDKSDTFRVLD
ncbi:MAG: M42 family metallopeptidase [Terrimicrobiaceae bacterium]|jgi:endoglucanase